jgi:hypothetical protein
MQVVVEVLEMIMEEMEELVVVVQEKVVLKDQLWQEQMD